MSRIIGYYFVGNGNSKPARQCAIRAGSWFGHRRKCGNHPLMCRCLAYSGGTTLQNSVNVAGDNGSGTATDDGVIVPEEEPQNPCLGNCIVFAYRLPVYILLTLSKPVQRWIRNAGSCQRVLHCPTIQIWWRNGCPMIRRIPVDSIITKIVPN